MLWFHEAALLSSAHHTRFVGELIPQAYGAAAAYMCRRLGLSAECIESVEISPTACRIVFLSDHTLEVLVR